MWRALAAVVAVVLGLTHALAFSDSTYAPASRLASGKWVKISVPADGLYAITPTQLRAWGFNDPERVRVCGYGARRIPDQLSKANYIDDLPIVQSVVTSDGRVVFFGAGPETWNAAVSGRYSATTNIYTTVGYYFVTELTPDEAADPANEIPEFAVTGRPDALGATDYFWQRIQHEKELTSPGQAGPQLVGEDFKYTPSREFKFDLPDRADDENPDIWFEVSFVAKTHNQASQLAFTANGKAVSSVSTDRVQATINDNHYHGVEAITRHTVSDIEGSSFTLKISHSSPAPVQGAWLNYIAVNYPRRLRLDSNGQLLFWSNSSANSLSNATASTRIFDVTNPRNISEVNASDLTASGCRQWTSSYTGMRTYVAFNDNATLPAPDVVGTVANQNLHGDASNGVPDMVILTNTVMAQQAKRIADMHAADPIEPLEVAVVDIEKVYNEFGSGMADVSAIRNYFKMLWDKGAADAPEGYESKFRYAILMGRTSYDFRMLTPEVRAFTSFVIPTWMSANMRQSLNDTDGYGSDDYMTLLKDNSGYDKGLDDLCIALGRIPVRTVDEARNYIDKLEQYVNSSRRTNWKNHTLFLADDADNGRHMEQAESFVANMSRIANNPLMVNKLYIDAYTREGAQYPAARDEMFRSLTEGVVWWTFIGHANDHSLTHNSQLTFNDLNNKMFFKNIPVFYGATCDFLRWDQNSLSGGELMFNERNGGAISIISATRPVYIYENGLLSNAMGRHLGARDTQGRLLTVGEIYRRAKNNILTDAGAHLTNANRLKFVLMGDPAMRLATPHNLAEVTEINGVALNGAHAPVELHGLQNAEIKGVIRTPDGELFSDFNGVVTVTLYDAEFSTTTNGNPDNDTEGKKVTFEQQGGRLTATSAQVVNGEFSLRLSVPLDISDNYRPAALETYAYSAETGAEASGLTNELYVYGYDDSVNPDLTAPVIESIYLNHQSFVDGDVTDPSPMLIAHISDDIAINLSTAGIGHSMSVQLDESRAFNDVAMYYTPATDGTSSGFIYYPLSNLTPGEHKLRLRVWDTSANSSTAEVSFIVSDRAAPKIYDIYTDASPAHDKANFYISHDRPDQMATVRIEVFNMLGQPVWSNSSTGMSDMFTTTPVTWNLTDMAGRRVSRGVYLYRATITVDGETFDTGSRRLAVAAY